MPSPDPDAPRRAQQEARYPVRPGGSARSSPQRATTGRQRPGPNSALAPSPTPLMPVPDPEPGDQRRGPGPGRTDDDRAGGDRGGRRQHHRRPDDPATHSEDLVYLSGRVPRPLRDELHIQAIHEGRPIVDLLREAIRDYLDQTHIRRSDR
jgi:hypothetical protein